MNLGEAAHIRGAAQGPGSRRFDPSMTSEERSSFANGIWLCRTCHTLVDSDEATYTAEELHQWKTAAESRAQRRLLGASASALRASRLYGVPRRPSMTFVGREVELAWVEEGLLESEAVSIAASIEGLPGIGKTELALQLVFRLALDGTFPGGIFWFNAENPDLRSAWGGEIADGLGIPLGPLEERALEARNAVRREQRSTLVVLDNVEAWSGDRRPGPLPEGTHLRYLVTTRQRRLAGSRFVHVPIGILEPRFARELIQRVSERDLAESPGLAELLKFLGGHALATELAGAFLGAFPEETPASYLKELHEHSGVEEEVSEHVRYERTVDQAFETLWERLEEPTRAAWRLAACFEPEPVTWELSEAVGLTGRIHRQLQQLHLIEVTEEGQWLMHRLTRRFGLRAGTPTELAAAQVGFVRGCSEFSRRIEYQTGLRPYLANRPHLDLAVLVARAVLPSGDSQIPILQQGVGSGLNAAGEYRKAQERLEELLAAGIERLGEDHPEVAARRSNLALVLKAQGDLGGARRLLEQALEADLERFGEDHPEVATRRSNLALVLQALGDLEGVHRLLEQALEAGLERFGEDYPEVATRRSNLALWNRLLRSR
ncbi:MAG: tetratricopeptide repeat protein [Acidobacteriota bacterium]